MATLTIRKLDNFVHKGLKILAGKHGTSMEEEARRILASAVVKEDPVNIVDVFAEAFGPEHGVRLANPDRRELPREVEFSE